MVPYYSLEAIPLLRLSRAWRLDSTQTAGVAQKNLQITTYTIPNNIYLAKIVVSEAPGVPDVEALPLAVPGSWIPPRL